MELPNSNPPSPDSTTLLEPANSNNSVLERIMKMKEERLKILHEFNKEHEDEMIPLMKDVQENVKKKESTPKVQRRKSTSKEVQSISVPVRRSQRISTKIEEEQSRPIETYTKVMVERPPNDYGPMPGIEVGHHWDTRMECSYDGVHRPTVAGIHGGPKGAYSIALSGGYPEDVDEGYTFTYTGAGGRDLKGTAMKPKNLRTAPQTKNQELEGVNYSLVRSIETGKPVRVIRGYKSDSPFAPETGYRYDGLYKVVKYWEDFGKTGFRIYRFKMVRMENQAPPPWEQPAAKSTRKRGSPAMNKENADPNAGSGSDDEDAAGSSESGYDDNVGDNDEDDGSKRVDAKDESELDEDIRMCSEKLCRSSLDHSKLRDSLISSPDSSFTGWD